MVKMRRRRGRDQRGVTLVDLIVGLTLLSVAAGGLFAAFKGSLNAWTIAQQVTGEQQNARMTLEWLARRLRMAGAGYGGARLVVADTSNIVFTGDIDGNGLAECYRVYLNPNAGAVYVVRTEPYPTQNCSTSQGDPLTSVADAKRLSVTGLTLTYFDSGSLAGSALTNLPLSGLQLASVKRIVVTIQVSGLQPTQPLTMSTQVVIRKEN